MTAQTSLRILTVYLNEILLQVLIRHCVIMDEDLERTNGQDSVDVMSVLMSSKSMQGNNFYKDLLPMGIGAERMNLERGF